MRARSFTMPSSTGRQFVRFRCTNYVEREDDFLLAFTISIGTSDWDRLEHLTAGNFEFPLVADSVLRFAQVIIRRSQLLAFEELLSAWILSQPYEIEFEFAGASNGQSFHFLLHDFRGTRALPDYQVFLSYSATKASSRICVNVDETCMTVLRDQLRGFLQSSRRTS